jgi:hypothetical protein
MNPFKTLKTLPRKPLIGLGLLAVALVAGGGAAAKQADAASSYTIEVTFDRVRWTSLSDGAFDGTAEVYGHMSANNLHDSKDAQHRQIGSSGVSRCTSGWSGSGTCNKQVWAGPSFFLSQTPLANTRLQTNLPNSAYSFFNNKVFLTVEPGNSVELAFKLNDYDSGSANDRVCEAQAYMSFTDAELQRLNFAKTLTNNSTPQDGVCEVVVALRRV